MNVRERNGERSLSICPFPLLPHAPPGPSAPRRAADHDKHNRGGSGGWRVQRNLRPSGKNDVVRVERFVAETAQCERSPVGQHLRLDLADESVDRLVIGTRCLTQMQEKRPRGGEIRVGALVERARTRPRCYRERPPTDRQKIEGSGSPPTAKSSCRTRSERWPAPGSQTDCR